MNGFPFRLAWWEGRATLRRIGWYGLSISIGVAALVAVRSFREDVQRSVRAQERVLMGADARLEADRPLPDSLRFVVDSLRIAGAETARVIRTVSMVAAPDDGPVRLLQVHAVDGRWPFYGPVDVQPSGAWRFDDASSAVVDRAVLIQLGITVGDTVRLGRIPLVVRGVVEDLPTNPGFQSAMGPRIWVSPEALDDAGLLAFGSLATFDTYIRIDDDRRPDLEGFDERYETLLAQTGVAFTTAGMAARRLTRAIDFLGRYLGLVGLGALLLGGLGVASAIHAFVKARLTQVAVLRCLGARQGSVFVAYLLQAAALGCGGAAIGVAAGLVIQQVLPRLLANALPVDVDPRISGATIAAGLALGVGVALIFALLPLLAVRDVPPLRAFRQSVERARRRRDPARLMALAALAASVVGLCIAEAPDLATAIAFAAALVVTTAALWLVGRGAIVLSRRFFPARAPYPVRQGFSNLFRPGNQTVAVTLALGLGAFTVGTVVQVQSNLARELAFEAAVGQPDLLLFDVQPDQRRGVLDLLPPAAAAGAETTPLVSARLLAIDGVAVEQLGNEPGAPADWAVRREYRHTWRDTLTDAETLASGAWWPDAPRAPDGVARISVETDLATDLGVSLGDRLTWSVEGIEVESVVTSLRTVDWDRFQTNFFVVFEPGPLDDAPASWVVLARIADPEALAVVQRDLISRYPNVSALDLGRVQEAVDAILSRVRRAVSFLAGFAALAGWVVLAGALAASRHQRLREGALLKTLGARRAQLLGVFTSEYLALGLLAALSGLGLSVIAAAALVRLLFGLPYVPALAGLASIAAAMGLLTVLTGLLGSRGLLRRPPLPVLRELID